MNSLIARTSARNAFKSTQTISRATTTSGTSSSSSSFASTSRFQLGSSIHTSQPLDPNQSSADSISQLDHYIKTQQPGLESSAGNDPTELAEGLKISVAMPTMPSLVHAPLSYLHPLTKLPSFPKLPSTLPTKIQSPPKSFIPLSSHVFGITPRRDVLHSSVVYYLDAQRSGTASTKNRSDIRGSGRKLRPQKGSGQARLGTMSSPLLRGGGVAHGPHPKDHSTKLNRKLRELALRSALSSKWKNGDLIIVKDLYWDKPPGTTNKLDRLLKTRHWSDSLVLTAPRNPMRFQSSGGKSSLRSTSPQNPIYDESQVSNHDKSIENFLKSCMNLPKVEMIKLHELKNDLKKNTNSKFRSKGDEKIPGELHAYEVLKRKTLILDLGALEWLEERLGGAFAHEEQMEENEVLSGLETQEDQELGHSDQEGIEADSKVESSQAEEEAENQLNQEVEEILEKNKIESAKV